MKAKTRYFLIAAVSGVILTLFSLAATNFEVFENVELQLVDWRFNLRGVQSTDDSPIVIVSIDDQAYEGIGDVWPILFHPV